MTNYETFLIIYTDKLESAIRKAPDKYTYPVEQAPEIAAKMTAALARGSANKDSLAIRQTCKNLGIAYRYTDIAAYLKG